MIFRNLDKNDDWTFGKGKNDYLSKNEAIGLDIKTRILSWVNDCFFDFTAGIDWFSRMGSKSQTNLLELDIRNILTKTDGVTGITNLDVNFNFSSRDFNVNYNIDTVFSKSYQKTIEVSI